MKMVSMRELISDESGVYTIWGLFWFMVFVAFAGMSVDVTNGFQSKTMLQGTADAAALAAAIDLPDVTQATATGIEYAQKNLPAEHYGNVLQPEMVEVGTWEHNTHLFVPGAPLPNAVRVRLQQSSANDNPVWTNFLRIIGHNSWDINVTAIAQRFIPACFTDGLIARGFVDTSSNNQYFNEFCVHGQQGVMMQNGSNFELGTTVSMPNLDAMLTIPTDGYDSNIGLRAAVREGNLNPRMVDHVPEIISRMLARDASILPSFIDIALPVIEVDWKFNLNLALPGRIYHVTCDAPNKQIGIPSQNVLRNVVVISECQIGVPANAVMENVLIASRAPAGNDGANIHLSSNINLGAHDLCAPGGGVQIFTTEALFFSSSTNYNGVQIVAAKNVTLGSSDEGVKGLSVQAGGNIYLSSNNRFGLCNGDDPLLMTYHYYRLVF